MTKRPARERPARRVAVVTGATGGLGTVVSRFLAGEGFELVVNARNRAALDTAAARLGSLDVPVHPVAGDVADPQVRARIATAVQTGGRLDLLVNNASDLGTSPLRPLAEFPLDTLERVYRVNVVAPLALVQSLLPELRTAHGLVVNVSSDAAQGGYPGWGAYGASKAALDLVSLTLSNELKDDGVSVASVDPGDMRTPMHQAAFLGQDISDRPLPEVTVPFWAWLLGHSGPQVTGRRFRAQSERWEANA